MKKFAGFTPQQRYTLLSKQGYTGPADEASMDKFLAASPTAASKMSDYARMAQDMLSGKTPQMATGGLFDTPTGGLFDTPTGGLFGALSTDKETPSTTATAKPTAPTSAVSTPMPSPKVATPTTAKPTAPNPNVPGETWLNNAQERFAGARVKLNADPSNQALMDELIAAQQNLDSAKQYYSTLAIPTSAELVGTALNDPSQLVSTPDVAKIATTPDQLIAAGTGQVAQRPEVTASTVAGAATATAPTPTGTATIQPSLVGQIPEATAVQGQLSDQAMVDAAQGKLSPGAMAGAATVDPKFIDKVSSGQLQVGNKELVTPAGQNAEAIKSEIAQSAGIADVVAQQGTVRAEELPQAATIKDQDMAQAQAITARGLAPNAVAVAAKLDKFSVDNETLAQAMQGEVSALDTVQGQLTELMKSFDDGATPAWAAGAIRAANAAMASRGLGGSSMAGAAIFQAAMESALPIAAQDAQVFANMNLTNLNNRQQVALSNAAAQQGLQLQNLNNEQQAALQNSANAFSLQSQNLSNMQQTMLANAQIKAALQGQNLSNQQQSNLATAARFAEAANINLNNRQQAALQNNTNSLNVELSNLSNKQQSYMANAQLAASLQGKQIDNQQQAAISNAARFAEAANITFTAEQQTVLHNSELMKTVGLAELNTKQAATLQNAANLANLDLTNLNNRQQAAVQNAQAFLQMDMTNLTNAQQTEMFNTQNTIQAMFSDQAAENAAKQFNAASQNQTDQFFAGLAESVSRFNADQKNTIAQFNAGQTNAVEQFNSTLEAQRDQFNAQNSLLIAQANAQWRQNVSTLDTAAQNDANMQTAQLTTALTKDAMDQFWQRERDLMAFAFQGSENERQRSVDLLIADKKLDLSYAEMDAADRASKNAFLLNIGADLIKGLF